MAGLAASPSLPEISFDPHATGTRALDHDPGRHRTAAFVAIAFVLFLAAPLASAGEWHTAASMVCSDCHTQHNSADGLPMRTDNVAQPARMLLRRGTAQELCLSCHAGTNAQAPDVIDGVTYVPQTAAGSFENAGGTASMRSHNLLNPTAEVPPGGTIAMVLECTTCHDPHGNENYRNLRPDPTRTGLTPVSVVVRQGVTANGSNPEQVYVPDNVIYKSGVSLWCEKCHGEPLAGSDHPDGVAMWGSAVADYTRWTSTTLPRVPVHSPSDDIIPSTDDQVICISCHRAHGTQNDSALIYSDGVTLDSTCQECHNQ
jgi:hypothetical protein